MGARHPMSTPTIPGTASVVEVAFGLDHRSWIEYLRGHLDDGRWRPGEFDPATWLFTGDVTNPATTSVTCLVAACATVVGSRTLCSPCTRALASSEQDRDSFVATHRPRPAGVRASGRTCVVRRGRQECARRQASAATGLCQAHITAWNRQGRGSGLSREQWSVRVATPLPARPECAMPGCRADSRLDVELCGHHHRVWRRDLANNSSPHRQGAPRPARSDRDAAARWAGAQSPRLQTHQFSLAPLAPTLRWELLYALQARDAQGHRLDPVAVRGLVTALTGLASIATTPEREVMARMPKIAIVGAYARLCTRIVALRFDTFRGMVHADRDVWDCLALNLDAPRRGRRANLASVDFTPIGQRWLRDAVKQWVATVRPESGKLHRTVQAATLASRALARRPGGGHDPAGLRFADMTAVFEAIRDATRADGDLYSHRYRRGLWARLHAVLDLGRSTEQLAALSAAFSRHPTHTLGPHDGNEDEIGKAIPQTVIAQLDTYQHLLEAGHTYGRSWSATATTTMFQAAYQLLRDTGRRPGEIVSLHADCLEIDHDQYALIYDNHKTGRLRRRLPITADTATRLQRWQHYRAGLTLPTTARQWLFPASNETAGPGHLSTIRFATAMRRWVDAIPTLHSDLPGPDGAPLPFDRARIYPYAFRHSYAQRHADAGVGVEILKELLDHRDMSVTQGYYQVSMHRKRDAITIMSRYVHDRTGTRTDRTPAAGSGSVTGYELRSVAVPFGNCIEPANVKAGGKQCPIRFQCAGCGFYRPDPSYLPAIETHITTLKADRETATALDAAEFIVRNLDDQAAAFTQVATTMRAGLDDLPADERAEIEQASTVLRKIRAGRAVTLLPLTVLTSTP
jgi:integrase